MDEQAKAPVAEPVHDPPAAPVAAPLVPPGNPLRLVAIVPALVGVIAAVAFLATRSTPRTAVPVVTLLTLVVVASLLDFLGTFHDDDPAGSVPVARFGLPAGLFAAGGGGAWLLLRAAVDGRLPKVASAVLVPLACIVAVAGVYLAGERLGPWARDENGEVRPLWRRHGFWLAALVCVLYLPMLGNRSLSDPWETHYGEVAREILARNDWISLWWAQDGWFWSKPVLTFWIQAAAMAVTGVRYEPGQMLTAAGEGRLPEPEWAVRMPVFLLTLVGVYLLYKGVARVAGRRAGLLGAVALVTMPQFFLIAQQTMTDMPFVACMGAAMGLFIYGSACDPEERAPSWEIDLGFARPRVSLLHLVLGAILCVIVPQILYLLSRNLSVVFHPWFDIRLPADTFSSGSPGNCVLPGNERCQDGLKPVVQRFEPALQALVWIQVTAIVLWASWGERRRKRLLYLGAWLFIALASMAKGPAGIVLPVVAAVAWAASGGRWRELMRMEIPVGLLVFAATALPWFVAMYVRHGGPFSDRLLFHDMWKRAIDHVHDTNKGDDTSFRYYVWQLGYAMFPWTGLVPLALVRWLRPGGDDERKRSGALVLAAWFLAGFALFASMGTKFHHYCLPIVPAAAMLTGLLLDDFLERRDATGGALLGAIAIGAAIVTAFVGRDLAWSVKGRLSDIRLVHLFTYSYERPWPDTLDFSPALWAFTIAAGVILLLLVVEPLRRWVVPAFAGLACVFTAWGLDVYMVKVSPHWSQRELLMSYEAARTAAPGPLVAYQMNWKGENFYRGNAVAAFVSSGRKFQQWIDDQKKAGAKTFYFVTEHKRVEWLQHELADPKDFVRLTDKVLNNKFILVRARFD
jgi:4-amino-4-deoxy-L-arabinose transferase-like glycosyltransferase